MNARPLAALGALLLAACATPGGQSGDTEIRSGVIEQITPVQLTSSHGLGVGAVVGGVVGLGVGSLIGKGSGRDVAMVLGTIGGAYAGHKVQQRYRIRCRGSRSSSAPPPGCWSRSRSRPTRTWPSARTCISKTAAKTPASLPTKPTGVAQFRASGNRCPERVDRNRETHASRHPQKAT